ncbi:15063_t:CDS:1, partial [Acaulospora colombiana]
EGKMTQKMDKPQHTRTYSSLTFVESPQRIVPPTELPSSSDRLPWSPCFVRALYDYEQAEATDLSFLKGDLIEITSMKDPSWWQGKLRDQIGVIPSNFVEVIDLRGASPRIAQPGPNAIGSQVIPNQASPTTKKELRLLIPGQNGELPLKKESNSPKPSPTMPHVPSSALSPASAAYPTAARWVRARHKWSSGKKNELEIQKGDVIQVIGRPHEHWWKGVLARNSATGLFPANFVEAIPSAAEPPSHSFSVGSPVNAQVTRGSGTPSTPSAAKKVKVSTSNNNASGSAPPIPDPRHWGSLRRSVTTSSRSTVLPQVPGSSNPSTSSNNMNQPSGVHRLPVNLPVGSRGKVTSPVGSRYEGRLSAIEADIAKARDQYPSDAPRKEARTRGLPTALAIFRPGKQRNQRPTIDGSDEHKTIYKPDKYNVIRHVVHGNHSPLPRNTPGGSRP